MHFTLGIDLGATNCKFGLVDNSGHILFRDSLFTDAFDTITQLLQTVHRLAAVEAERFEGNIIGVGMGAPNANSRNRTIDNAVNLKWKGILPMSKIAATVFGEMPFALANDASAAAIGEWAYGGARGVDDFVVVTLGTGVGGGIFCGGRLVAGAHSYGGELGHITVRPNGRRCSCGRQGCLEAYASAGGIVATAQSLNSEMQGSLSEYFTAAEVAMAATNGDPVALQTFEFTGQVLGEALADIVHLLDPETIFICGGVAAAGKLLFEPTQRSMEQNLMDNFKGKVRLQQSSLESADVAILGAASLVGCI